MFVNVCGGVRIFHPTIKWSCLYNFLWETENCTGTTTLLHEQIIDSCVGVCRCGCGLCVGVCERERECVCTVGHHDEGDVTPTVCNIEVQRTPSAQ